VERNAANTARQRLARMSAPPVLAKTVGGFSQKEIAMVAQAYRDMLSVQGLYNQKASREQLVGHVLQSARGVEIASRALTDPSFAWEAFHEFQAEARFFSIEVLKTAARNGNKEVLLHCVRAMAHQLAQMEEDEDQPLDEGRVADLRDLLLAAIDTRGVDAFSSGDPRLVEEMGYSPRLPSRVKAIYDDVLFIRLKRQFGRERAAAITARLLEG
jgi:hypothetical protein